MATQASFVDMILDQLSDLPQICAKKMFGEYALYANQKVVGLICDNQLFIKPTIAGQNFLGDPSLAPPYTGAKDYFVIDADLEDRQRLTELIRLTEQELPVPPIKRPRKRRS